MGACSSQKKPSVVVKAPQASSIVSINQDLRIQKPAKTYSNERILKKFKRLCGLMDLISGVDELEKGTRMKIADLTTARSNVQIIIQNNLRRALREKNIVRSIQPEDEELLNEDALFSKAVGPQLIRIVRNLTALEKDESFENAFPILSVSLKELNQEIRDLDPLLETTTKHTEQ